MEGMIPLSIINKEVQTNARDVFIISGFSISWKLSIRVYKRKYITNYTLSFEYRERYSEILPDQCSHDTGVDNLWQTVAYSIAMLEKRLQW